MRRTVAVLAAVASAAAVFGILTRVDPLQPGLRADYFQNPAWSAAPVASRVETEVSTGSAAKVFGGVPPAQFSIAWSGWLVALRSGRYTFEMVSDDGSFVFVDGQQVVANPGRHGPSPASGSLDLAAGAHSLQVRYFQDGGDYQCALRWARAGAPLAPIPAWALRTRRGSSTTRVFASVLLGFALVVAEWVSVVLLVALVPIALRPAAARLKARLARDGMWPALGWIVAGSLLVNVVGIWWGLPGRWVSIEVNPEFVFDGLAHRFARGWYEAYPPVHYYVLAIAYTPALVLGYLGRIDFNTISAYVALMVIGRLVSLAAAAAIVIAIAIATATVFGPRPALFSAAIVALITPFLYYAKTANVDVPYLFWFALSLTFYVRMLDDIRLVDLLAFATTGMLAICTKDQAYALYLLAPVAVVYRIWQVNRRRGASRALWRAIVDRRLIVSAAVTAVVFALCYNLPANISGLIAHVRFIVGPGSVGYRVFEPTLAGRWALLRTTIRLIQLSMGWPLFIVSVAGLVCAACARRSRAVLGWLMLPVVAYYLGFIDVVLYNYDRFVLPICFILAMFGGLALDRWLRPSTSWRAALIALFFAYTILYSTTVDVLMVGDSRYTAQRWLAAHVGPTDAVGVAGPRDSVPRVDEFNSVDISSIDELRRAAPAYFVLNADYARSATEEREWGQMVAGLQHGSLGYRRVFTYRRPSPWPWLPLAHPDLVGPRTEEVVFSTLHSINPTIEVFRREERAGE